MPVPLGREHVLWHHMGERGERDGECQYVRSHAHARMQAGRL